MIPEAVVDCAVGAADLRGRPDLGPLSAALLPWPDKFLMLPRFCPDELDLDEGRVVGMIVLCFTLSALPIV